MVGEEARARPELHIGSQLRGSSGTKFVVPESFNSADEMAVVGLVVVMLAVTRVTGKSKCQECADRGDWRQTCSGGVVNVAINERRCVGGCQKCRWVPRMFYADICTGSTFSRRTLDEVFLRPLGVKVMKGGHMPGHKKDQCTNTSSALYLNGDWEITKTSKACFYEKDDMAESLAKTHAAVVEQKGLLLFNPPPLDKETAKKAVDLGTRAVSMIRSNVLDRLICKVRDCFDRQRGTAVNGTSGNPTTECFHRRRLANPLATKALLHPHRLIAELQRLHDLNSKQIQHIRDLGFSDVVPVTYEFLTAFEYDSGDGRLVNQSVREWATVLDAFGFALSQSDISDRLHASGWIGSRPLESHHDLIFNYDAVASVLSKNSHQHFIRNLLRP